MSTYRSNLSAARRALLERHRDLITRGAEIVRDEIVDVMRRSVPAGEDGRSAPGQPPAYGKGVYARSWKSEPAELHGEELRAVAFSVKRNPEGRLVAVELEYGGEHNAPRPHVRPSLPTAAARIAALVRDAT